MIVGNYTYKGKTEKLWVLKTDSDLKNGLSGISRAATERIVNSALY